MPSTPPLVLTAAQALAVRKMQQLSDNSGGFGVATLADALGGGVQDPSSVVLIPAITQWASQLTPAQQQVALNGLCQGFAALMAALGLTPPVGFSGTVTIPPLTVNPGSLTFINGICTAAVDPS